VSVIMLEDRQRNLLRVGSNYDHFRAIFQLVVEIADKDLWKKN
jgi:hypothetical protein